MSRQVTFISPSFPLNKAWRLMRERQIRHLPVVQAQRLVGILSDRDVLLRGRRGDDGELWVADEPVETAMTPAPITCTVHTSVCWLAQSMITRHIDAVPVLDAGGELVGLVTSVDLIALLIDYEEGERLPFEFRLQPGEAAGATA